MADEFIFAAAEKDAKVRYEQYKKRWLNNIVRGKQGYEDAHNLVFYIVIYD